VLVLPTSQENFGFVLVESLACGTPVVTTKGVDLWAELEASGGGVIANAEGNAVAKAVVRVLHTDQGTNMREAMGAKGRAWALAMMEPAGLIGAYESMYRGT
jgi:glycosyltransferase involved in cell wall biosynthesis